MIALTTARTCDRCGYVFRAHCDINCACGGRATALTIPPGGEAVECNECTGGEAWGQRCETCNGHGYVVTENIMEREWSNIGEAALEIAGVVMDMDAGLGIAADNLQALIAKASDTKHDDDDLKRDVIGVWRATLENIRAAQIALTTSRK